MDVLDYLAKLKRSLGLSFGAQWTKFQCHTLFPSQDIKHNVLLSSDFDS